MPPETNPSESSPEKNARSRPANPPDNIEKLSPRHASFLERVRRHDPSTTVYNQAGTLRFRGRLIGEGLMPDESDPA